MKRARPKQHYRRIRTKKGIKRKLINKGVKGRPRKVKRRMLSRSINWKELAKKDTSYMLPHEVLEFVDIDNGIREIKDHSKSAFQVNRKKIPQLYFKMKKDRKLSKELGIHNLPDPQTQKEIHFEKLLQKEEKKRGEYNTQDRTNLFKEFMKKGEYHIAFDMLPQGAKNSLALARGFPKDMIIKEINNKPKIIMGPPKTKSKNIMKGSVSMKDFNKWLEEEKRKRGLK